MTSLMSKRTEKMILEVEKRCRSLLKHPTYCYQLADGTDRVVADIPGALIALDIDTDHLHIDDDDAVVIYCSQWSSCLDFAAHYHYVNGGSTTPRPRYQTIRRVTTYLRNFMVLDDLASV